MDIYELFEAQRELANQYIAGMTEVLPQDLGLLRSAAYRLYINKEAIAVSKVDDSNLQFWGGFEYIDKAYRTAIGDWVIYSLDDQTTYGEDEDDVCRVGECLNRYYETEGLCPVED